MKTKIKAMTKTAQDYAEEIQERVHKNTEAILHNWKKEQKGGQSRDAAAVAMFMELGHIHEKIDTLYSMMAGYDINRNYKKEKQ